MDWGHSSECPIFFKVFLSNTSYTKKSLQPNIREEVKKR